MSAPPVSVDLLEPGQVHVWRVDLDCPDQELADLRKRLSNDELEREARFRREVDRGRYIVAHAALRMLLARYLNVPEYRDAFDIGPDGKPSLGIGAGVHFNLAHSRGLGLVALTGDTRIGVDIEAIDHTLKIDTVAERFFSSFECSALRGLGPERRREGFFHVWSQKEAYLKGRGDGVVHGLDHFDVVADLLEGAGLLTDRKEPCATLRWKLFSLDPGEGFRGALAVEGGTPTVHRYDWS
jgi:4'-phosphopantetheinyl transferase